MKQHIFKLSVIIVLLSVSCTESWLEVTPRGIVTEEALLTPNNADALVTAAYATLLDRSFGHDRYGGWHSDNAYKGGAGPADGGAGAEWLETYVSMNSQWGTLNSYWTSGYAVISRCNKAMVVLNKLTDAEMPLRKVRIAEMRFIRGMTYFYMKRFFKYPVYVDETIAIEDLKTLSNRAYTDNELWNKIAEEFQYGYDNLPPEQTQVGRANKYAAAAFLAMTRLYQAYEQDEQNNVVNINQARLQEVVDMCDAVINSGKYGLFDNFGKNFTYGYDNGIESIFAIQFSINDGTPVGKLDTHHMLNYNMGPGYGCCWFNVPTQNLVNAFRTVNGLPTETFNDIELMDPEDFQTNTIDPRIDHTVGVPGHPFKYELDFVYTVGWARTPAVYGVFSTMKETQLPTCPCFKAIGPFFGASKNYDYMRYDDVLLMKAEALIELDREDEALPIINQIRTRAANTDWLKFEDNSTFSNYDIQTYQDGVNCTWDKDFARNALRWERRLEFAMEDTRYFDLVRWGIAAETLNAYLAVEKTRRPHLSAASYTKNRDEYFPIPDAQITLSEGLYEQNYGW